MQNRFGFKDFCLFLLVAGVGLAVFLNMVKTNREWDKLREVQAKVAALEGLIAGADRPERERHTELVSRLNELAKRIDQAALRPAQGTAPGESASAAPVTGTASASSVGNRDTSWARPDVAIAWQEPWAFTNDPTTQPGFKEGGTFTEVFEARPAKLTPHIQTDVYGRRPLDLICDTLGAYDPKTLMVRGTLADAWQMAPDGMWLRVRIRADARFSDGKPVTAEDVRWTFHEYIMNPQIEAQRARSTLSDQIDKVAAISEKVIEFTFREPRFNNLDAAVTGIYVLPKHFYGTLTPSQINKSTGLVKGSGPYKLKRLDINDQWTPGQTIELVRNEFYYGPRSPIEELRFRDITDELARLTAYRNGEADMITPAAPQFASLRKDEEFVKNNQMFASVTMRSGRSAVIWNCGERGSTRKLTPFHDKRVRQAMTMLLDREKMIRDIWAGIGQVAKGFMNPNFPGSDPDIKSWPVDVDRAKALLKEAGWEDRNNNGVLENAAGEEFVFEFTFFSGGEIAQRIATFVKDTYESHGIRVTLRGVDWSVGDPIRKQRDYDAMTMGWGASAPESDPKQIFHSDSIKDQGDNFAQWKSPAADAAIDALRREVDFNKRMEHWREFDRVMHEEQPYTWVRLQPEVRVVKPDIGNAGPLPKGYEVWQWFRGSGSVMMTGN